MRSSSLAAVAALALALAAAARAEPPALKPPMAGIAFLAGDWSGGRGVVADTGERSTGSSHMEFAAGGGVLLRRDQTRLFDAAGKPTGGFEQVMMVYAEGGGLRAEYADGTHVIHYTSAEVVPGRSVTFSSGVPGAGAPVFRLSYTQAAPATLTVAFSMAPPGSAAFRPIATGTLTRNP